MPLNTFGYARELLGPETEFVSPNSDTLYVIAPCDVRGGPLRLHVPDTGGRYYVLQFVDAWSNNFAYIGRRATGTAAGDYLWSARTGTLTGPISPPVGSRWPRPAPACSSSSAGSRSTVTPTSPRCGSSRASSH